MNVQDGKAAWASQCRTTVSLVLVGILGSPVGRVPVYPFKSLASRQTQGAARPQRLCSAPFALRHLDSCRWFLSQMLRSLRIRYAVLNVIIAATCSFDFRPISELAWTETPLDLKRSFERRAKGTCPAPQGERGTRWGPHML